MASKRETLELSIFVLAILMLSNVGRAFTGVIHGRVVCDMCDDSLVGPEDHALEGAEVAVLCVTKSGQVVNYQAFTNEKGRYDVAETMSDSHRWVSCFVRPIKSFNEHCPHLREKSHGVMFSYHQPSGYPHKIKPFVYHPATLPAYCSITI